MVATGLARNSPHERFPWLAISVIIGKWSWRRKDLDFKTIFIP